jgi:hypothetical protein
VQVFGSVTRQKLGEILPRSFRYSFDNSCDLRRGWAWLDPRVGHHPLYTDTKWFSYVAEMAVCHRVFKW